MTDQETAVEEVVEAAPEPVGPVLQLLRDVAESEHYLRHPAAFADLCDQAGYVVVKLAHKVTVEAKGG